MEQNRKLAAVARSETRQKAEVARAPGRRDPASHQPGGEVSGDEPKPRLKRLGGSDDDDFNRALAEATKATAWIANEADRAAAVKMVGCGLAAIAPRDELEGLVAAQMVAAHQASMEAFRRAITPGQTVPARDMNLSQASKASSRTFAALLEALNRHRSKGQQRVIVEHVHRHVHVHDSGSTIPVTPGGGQGGQIEKASQPHAQQAIGYAIEPALRSEDSGGEPMSLPCDGERTLPNARRGQPGRADG